MSKVISELLWFCITSLSDWFKVLAPLFQPIRSETKTNRGSRVHIFPRLRCRLRVITPSFDWFTRVSPSFLIGQSNYFRSFENRSKNPYIGFPPQRCFCSKEAFVNSSVHVLHWNSFERHSMAALCSRAFSFSLNSSKQWAQQYLTASGNKTAQQLNYPFN